MVNCASNGMSTHNAEGIWPVGYDCSTEVKNLYAAGNSLGTMTNGAAYASIGMAFTNCLVTGKIAGETAGKAAVGCELVMVDDDVIAEKFEKIYAPLNRVGGFSTRWVIQLLQNITMPYFNLIIKEEKRLQSALAQVEYLKNDVVPKIWAHDAHELRLAIETANMVMNAEIKLRACIERKESRGTHYREDYPQRDEENYSVWLAAKQVDDGMQILKHPIPKEWAWHTGEPRLIDFDLCQ